MQVKCYFAEGVDVDKSMMELMVLTDSRGSTGLGALTNTNAGISLIKNRGALIMTGGRESITRFLYNQGNTTLIIGVRPFLVSFARKHRMLGKNETCVKLVSGGGHRQPADGSDFTDLSRLTRTNGQQLIMTPSELSHSLWATYGWG